MKRIAVGIVSLLLFVTLFAGGPKVARASPEVVLPVPSILYPTITAAIIAATPGAWDEIHVDNNYTGTGETFPIVVNTNSLRIIGRVRSGLITISTTVANQPVIRVTASNVLIYGFIIQNANAPGGCGIEIDAGTTNVQIWGNDITNNDVGVQIASSNNLIACNTIETNNQGIVIDANQQWNFIRGNNIQYNAVYGIVLNTDCTNNRIIYNFFTLNGLSHVNIITTLFNYWDDSLLPRWPPLYKGNYWSPLSDYASSPPNRDDYPNIISPFRIGDINQDERVDVLDLYMVVVGWFRVWCQVGWEPRADLDRSDRIDLADLNILGISWGYRDP